MGARGPLRSPSSRRGQAEIRKRQKLTAISSSENGPSKTAAEIPPDLPVCDPKTPRRVQEIYRNLVIDLAGAKVPIKQIDSHAITMAARCLASIESAEEIAGDDTAQPETRLSAIRLVTQASKDLVQWLQLICATPGTRARIGLKTAPEKKAGPLAALLAAKQRRA